MTETQFVGAFLLALCFAAPVVMILPAFCRWGVECRGYRHLCFTRKGAERLAAYAREVEGWDAIVVRIG